MLEKLNAQPDLQAYDSLIGLEAPDLLVVLPSIVTGLSAITLLSYEPTEGLQERMGSATSNSLAEIFKEVEHLRNLTNNDLPYWEAVVAVSAGTNKFAAFVREALRHDQTRASRPEVEIPISELSRTLVQERIQGLNQKTALALTSKCKLVDGSVGHLPLMDFRCKPNPQNLTNLKLALRELGQLKGLILDSGRSYHYYGLEPIIDRCEWTVFLSKCLLLAPMCDSRYIAHRLMEDMCVLRITAAKLKPRTPIVVDHL